MTNEEKKLLQDKIEEANKYKYSQSGKGSELIRKIVFAIIGSCWILMFAKGKYQETNIFLKLTIACSFIYLLLDVVHYFWDTCSYHLHAENLERCTSTDYMEHIYKQEDQRISKRSFVFFVMKVIACFAVSGAFVLGMFIEPLYGQTHLSSSQQLSQMTVNNPTEVWKCDSVSNGYVWKLYRNSKNRNQDGVGSSPSRAAPFVTIHFDNHAVVKSIVFDSNLQQND